MKVSDIPTLLTPIAQAKTLSEFAQPPQSDHEVYERLVRLLRFSGTSNRFDAGRMLTCHREYTFLESLTCTLSGHKVPILADVALPHPLSIIFPYHQHTLEHPLIYSNTPCH